MSIRGLTLEQIHDLELEHTPLLGFRGRYFGASEAPRELEGDDPFVGRDIETKRLTRTYREKQVICLYGNAGVGKTRFVAHALASLASRSTWLDWSTMSEAWPAASREVAKAASAPTQSGDLRTCVVVDNVDSRSSDSGKRAFLEWIGSLHTHGEHGPVRIVLCGRGSLLSQVLPAGLAAGDVLGFALGPLSARDVAKLLVGSEKRAGVTLDRAVRREVAYACAGNPYFLNEIVLHADFLRQEVGKERLVVTEADARRVVRAALPGIFRKLPDRVDVLRSLTPKEQVILEAVAQNARFVGGSFSTSLDAASRAARVDATRLLAILRNLTSKGDLLEVDMRSKAVHMSEGLFICAFRTLHWLNSSDSRPRERLNISAIVPE